MDLAMMGRSVALFVVAGLLEIGGGYLVWLWLRDGRGIVLGAIGGLVLFLYGVIPTLQPSTFGRTTRTEPSLGRTQRQGLREP